MTPKSKPRLDALEKVMGTALYADDLVFPDMLHVVTIHCPFPHARILHIDGEQALKVPSVVGIYTAKDCQGGLSSNPKDKPVLVENVAKCCGDGVALVAAETKKAAHEAAALVNIKYEELPAIFDARQAVEDDAPLVHSGNNIICCRQMEKGDVEQGFEQADIIVECEFSTPRYHHGAIEPDAVIAVPENGGLTLHCCTKGPFAIHDDLCRITGLPHESIRIVHPTLGGTFGGKETDTSILAGRAAIVAQKTGRPAKLLFSREECMAEGTKRHPFFVRYKIGAKRDGRLVAMQVRALADGGAYSSKTPGVVGRAATECTGPYDIPHVSVDIKGVFTNNVFCDAVRGLGSPQVYFGLESAMNVLADELGISPFALRQINALHDGSVYATGQTLSRVGISACLERFSEVFDCSPTDKPLKIVGDKAYGRGFACQLRGESRGSGQPDICGVDLQVDMDGTVGLSCAISEMGQGTHTGIARYLAKQLCIDWNRFYDKGIDTSATPYSTPTTASRGALSGVNAALLAMNDLIKQLTPVAAGILSVSPEDIFFSNGQFFAGNGGRSVCFDDTVCKYYTDNDKPLVAKGRWVGPDTDWDFKKKQGNAYFSYSYGVTGAEIAIDLITGKLEVTNLVSVQDAGNVIYPEGAVGQLVGGMVMALGHSVSEELECVKGRVRTQNFDNYLMPTSVDLHTINGFAESLVPAENPLGIHGLGEASTVLVAPAISNAIHDAIGIRIYDLPFSLERIRTAAEDAGLVQKGARDGTHI